MATFYFQTELWLPRPLSEIFAFFSDVANLEAITPAWLRFRVITPAPIRMREGAEIDYQLRIRGVPAQWRSRITVWDPPHRFVDDQVRGPYNSWVHEHRFRESAGGTLCEDLVQYSPPGGALINRLVVERDVRKIFAYRSERLQHIFGRSVSASASNAG